MYQESKVKKRNVSFVYTYVHIPICIHVCFLQVYVCTSTYVLLVVVVIGIENRYMQVYVYIYTNVRKVKKVLLPTIYDAFKLVLIDQFIGLIIIRKVAFELHLSTTNSYPIDLLCINLLNGLSIHRFTISTLFTFKINLNVII